MSCRPWLEGLKGTIKENVLDTDVPTEEFWKPYSREGAKGAKATLDTLLHLLHPRHSRDTEKLRYREGSSL